MHPLRFECLFIELHVWKKHCVVEQCISLECNVTLYTLFEYLMNLRVCTLFSSKIEVHRRGKKKFKFDMSYDFIL